MINLTKIGILVLLHLATLFSYAQDNPRLLQAYEYHNAGNLDKAIELYKEVAIEEPTNGSSYYNMSFIYHGRKDYVLAITQMKKAQEIMTWNSVCPALIGLDYLMMLNLPEAKKYCQIAYDMDSSKYAYASNLSFSFLLMGDQVNARKYSLKTATLISTNEEFDGFVKEVMEFNTGTIQSQRDKELAQKELDFMKSNFAKNGSQYIAVNQYIAQGSKFQYEDQDYPAAALAYENAFKTALAAKLPNLTDFPFQEAVFQYEYLDKYDKVIELGEMQYNLYKTKSNSVHLANAASRLGYAYKSLNQYEKAIAYYKEAIAIYQKKQNTEKLNSDYNELGQCYDFTGLHLESIQAYTESLEAKKKMNDVENRPITLNNLGSVYREIGQYDKALVVYEEAVKSCNDGYSKESMSLFKNGLGNTYYTIGDNQNALKYFEEAADFDRKAGNESRLSGRLSNIGMVYASLKQFDKAKTYFNEAIVLAQKSGNASILSISYNELGEVYFNEKNYTEAIKYYEKAIDLDRKVGLYADLAAAMVNVSKIYIINDQLDKANAYLTEAEPLIRKTNDITNLSGLLMMKGSVHMRQEKYHEAAAYFQETVDITEKLRKNTTGTMRTQYLSKQNKNYQFLSTAYAMENVPGSANRSFNVIELSRAKSLAEKLAGYDNVSILEIESLQDKIPNNTAILDFANANQNPILEFLVTNEYMLVQWTNKDEFNEKVLQKYQGEVNYVLENQRGMKLVKTDATTPNTGSNAGNVLVNQNLDNIITYYRALLMSTGAKDNRGMKVSALENSQISNADKAKDVGRLLYDLLIQPIEDKLQNKTELIIITDGILGYLPFETLVDGNGKYLIEKFHITYTQSAKVLDIIQNRNYSTTRKPMLAVGGAIYDPTSYSQDMVDNQAELENVTKVASETMENKGSLKNSYGALGLSDWINLPGTLTEVQAIAQTLPGTQLLTASQVTENNIKALSASGELANYKVIHFATHGMVVPAIPEMSALVLSQFQTEQGGEDGYLRMAEIEKLSIKADFINLSACETGLGKIYGGEGVVGLTQAFLIAGANGLSVSLWQVADESTSKFMVGMYELSKNQNMSYAKAITEMKRKFINGEYGELNRSPYFWAPFVYYGK